MGEYKVAYFDKNPYFDRPMLISAVKNLKRLEKLIGSPYIEDWANINVRVTLQQEMDKTLDGGKDFALRFSEKAPEKPKLESGTELWVKVVTALKAGNFTLEKVKNHYSVSESDLKLLKDETVQDKGE
jgi:hypothetical protein